MDKKPIEHSCPFCQADPGRPCKNAGGRKLLGFHRHRYQLKKPPMGDNRPASEIAPRATGSDQAWRARRISPVRIRSTVEDICGSCFLSSL